MPNQNISGSNLLEICHRALNVNTKVVVDIITSGALMSMQWELSLEILDWISNTKQGKHTWVADRGVDTYVISACSKKNIIYEIVS